MLLREGKGKWGEGEGRKSRGNEVRWWWRRRKRRRRKISEQEEETAMRETDPVLGTHTHKLDASIGQQD